MVNLNIFILAKNNIKKSKNVSVTLMILIMFSTILLYIGSSIILNLGSFFDNKVKELNDANVCVIIHNDYLYQKCLSILKDNSHTKKVESEEMISFDASTFKNGRNDVETQLNICDESRNRTLSSLKYTEKLRGKVKNGIDLSYNFKSAYGYKLGDKITFKCGKIDLTFTVKGFFEDTLYNNNSYTLETKVYVPHEDYEKLSKTLSDDHKYKIINIKTDTIKNSDVVCKSLVNGLSEGLKGNQNDLIWMNSSKSKSNSNMFINILMAILIAFSIILIVIVLIVIGFSIATYIDDNVKNIGVLQALGYDNRQVISVNMLQFMMITGIGSIVGLIVAFITAPLVANMVSSIVGLMWPVKINIGMAFLSVIFIISLVMAITYISSKRIKKITPIVALRDGIETHNFRKNHIKLDGYNGNLNFAISIKNIFHYLKQNLMISVIILSLTFVSIFSTIIYYNFIVNNNFIVKMLGAERINVSIDSDSKTNDKIYNDMKQNKDVRKVIRKMSDTVLFNNQSTALYVYENYSNLELNTVYEGRNPIHDNEVVISNKVAKKSDKNVGDTINLKINGISKNFIVVGISQHMTNYGRSIGITEKGYQRYDPDFRLTSVGVYLKNPSQTKKFMKMLDFKYDTKNITITDYSSLVDSVVESFKIPIEICVVVFISITLIFVCLILMLLIKVRLSKDRTYLGIYKALGYTTSQLKLQTILSLMPVVIFGTLLGTISGCLFSNSLMAFILSSMGINNCSLTIDYLYVAVVIVLINAASCIFAGIAGNRIRKISPYELMGQ